MKGPLKADFWGNKYMVTFNCDVTHMTAVYFCKTKAEVKDRLEDFIKYVNSTHHEIVVLTSDNGGEYSGGENNKDSPFNSVCVKNNIFQLFTAPYTPSQNGRSERVNKTLCDAAACLLQDAALNHRYWSLAVKHVCWLKNRVHHKALKGKSKGMSPFEAAFKRPPPDIM